MSDASGSGSPLRPAPRLEGTHGGEDDFDDANRTSSVLTDSGSDASELDPPHLGATLSAFFLSSRVSASVPGSAGGTPLPVLPAIESEAGVATSAAAATARHSSGALELKYSDTSFDAERDTVTAGTPPGLGAGVTLEEDSTPTAAAGAARKPRLVDFVFSADSGDVTPPPPAIPVQPASLVKVQSAGGHDAMAVAVSSMSVDDMAAATEAAMWDLEKALLSRPREGLPDTTTALAHRDHAPNQPTSSAIAEGDPAAPFLLIPPSSRASSADSRSGSRCTIKTESLASQSVEDTERPVTLVATGVPAATSAALASTTGSGSARPLAAAAGISHNSEEAAEASKPVNVDAALRSTPANAAIPENGGAELLLSASAVPQPHAILSAAVPGSVGGATAESLATPLAATDGAAGETAIPPSRTTSTHVAGLRALHEQALQLVALIFSVDSAMQRLDFARSLQQLMRQALAHPLVAAHPTRRVMYARAMSVAVAVSHALSGDVPEVREVDAAATEFLTHLRQLDAALDAPAAHATAGGSAAPVNADLPSSQSRGYTIEGATRAVLEVMRHEALPSEVGSRYTSRTSTGVSMGAGTSSDDEEAAGVRAPTRSHIRLIDDFGPIGATGRRVEAARAKPPTVDTPPQSASSRRASAMSSLLGPPPGQPRVSPPRHASLPPPHPSTDHAPARLPHTGAAENPQLLQTYGVASALSHTNQPAHPQAQPPLSPANHAPATAVDPAVAARAAALNAKILRAIEREQAQDARGAALMVERLRSAARHAVRTAIEDSSGSAGSPERPIPPLPAADVLRRGFASVGKRHGSPRARSGSGSPHRRGGKASVRDAVPRIAAAEMAVRRVLNATPTGYSAPGAQNHNNNSDAFCGAAHWDDAVFRAGSGGCLEGGGGGELLRKRSTVSYASDDSFITPFGAPATATTLGTLRVAVNGIQAMERSGGGCDDTRRELVQRRREAELGLLPGAFSQQASVDAATTAPISASRLVSHIAGCAPALAGIQRSSPRRPPLTRTALEVHLEEHRRMLQLQRISTSTADGGAAFTRTRNDFGHIEFQRMGRDLAVIQQAKQGRQAVDAAIAALAAERTAAEADGGESHRATPASPAPSVLRSAWARAQQAKDEGPGTPLAGPVRQHRAPSTHRANTSIPTNVTPASRTHVPVALDPPTRPAAARPVGAGSVAGPLRAVTPRSVSRPRAAAAASQPHTRAASLNGCGGGPIASARSASRGTPSRINRPIGCEPQPLKEPRPVPASYRLDPVLADPPSGAKFELALRSPRLIAAGPTNPSSGNSSATAPAFRPPQQAPVDPVRRLQEQLISMAKQEAALRAKRQNALDVLALAERQFARSRSTPLNDSAAEGAGFLTPGSAQDPETALLHTRSSVSQLLAKLDAVQAKLSENMAMVHDLLTQALTQ